MNTIKTVFLAALLSAAAYGVYVGVTGSPPNFGPRRKAQDWDELPAPDLTTDADLTDSPSAPLLSVDDGSHLPANGLSGTAVPPTQPGGIMPADTQSAGSSPPAQSMSPLPSDVPPDRYVSNHTYPSMRDPAPPTPDASRSADRYVDSPNRVGSGAGAAGSPDAAGSLPPHDIHSEYAAVMQSAQSLLTQNHLAEALLELSDFFGHPELSPEEDARLTDLLDRLAGTVIYSRQHLLEHPYEVQPGDTLEKIADTYDVPWQLLANINGLRDPRAVRPGDQLKVVRGPFGAHIDLGRLRLVLYLGNRYAGRFPIGLGDDYGMTEGKFEVVKKALNPTYYGQPMIDKDDPSNPLGEYALDLGGGILIHGTNDPTGVGRVGGKGCIRLSEHDIKDVFEILSVRTDRTAGSPIIIKRDSLQ